MPNGGDVHFEMGCPNCKSLRIHQRHKFHLIDKWRCDNCHNTFMGPVEVIITDIHQEDKEHHHERK